MKKNPEISPEKDNHLKNRWLSGTEISDETELFCRNITDNTPVKIWITNSEGLCIYLNKRWYDFTGQNPDEALDFGWLEVVHPEDKKQATELFLDANSKKIPFLADYRLKNKNGEYKWHQNSGQPTFHHGKFDGFIGVSFDIDDRKKAEESLRQSEAWYKTYSEAMPQMAFIADAEGNIIHYNQRLYNYVAGIQNTEGWGWKDKPIHHPADLERTIKRWTHSLKTGESYEIEYRLRRHDGEYRWHLGRAMPVTGNNGKIEHWIGTNTDIHEQKTNETSLEKANASLQSKNQKLKKARKLRKSLLYIIAHDLRNPLANMFLTLDILNAVEDPKDREILLTNLRKMVVQQEKVIDGLSEIVQVQTFEKAQFTEINLQKVTDEITGEFQHSLQELNGEVVYDFSKLPIIIYVESFISSILKNLISNAIKYRHENRPPKIKITSEKVGEFALISIKDNGTGMDLEKHRKELFQPFQRFTEHEEGTGIGLYIVKNLIEGNGGKIEIDSEPGAGTTFLCYFKEYN